MPEAPKARLPGLARATCLNSTQLALGGLDDQGHRDQVDVVTSRGLLVTDGKKGLGTLARRRQEGKIHTYIRYKAPGLTRTTNEVYGSSKLNLI